MTSFQLFVKLLCVSGAGAASIQSDFVRDSTLTLREVGTPDVKVLTQAYKDGLALSESADSNDNVTASTIRLIGFDGCTEMSGVPNAEAQIYSGWQQAQKIMALPALREGSIDFNTAGALEYLGASGLNAPRHNDMNQIFKTFTTLTPAWWPFGYKVHVRCDDPLFKCTCGAPGTMRAYTSNYDLESKIARINFCPRYLEMPTLNSAIEKGKTLPSAQKYNMERYWNTQGHVWTHEFMHIDWVTGAYGPHGRYGTNEHVTDMKLQFRDTKNRLKTVTAHGPEMANILARWPSNTGDYTIRNADNLALFITSQYVQAQLGNNYPDYPLVNLKPERPPWRENALFLFNPDGSVLLNDTHPAAAAIMDDNTACNKDQEEANPSPILFSSFAPDEAYPSAYISSRDSWLAGANPTGIKTVYVTPIPATKTDNLPKTVYVTPVPA